jgi:predicted nucleic acid-binding Zn ribbon protein
MPTYLFCCPGCDKLVERYLTYEEFDRSGQAYPSYCTETHQTELLRPAIVQAPPIHYKGYGFYRTDARTADENYDYDHFDGSGTNPEIKAINRRIKSPHSSVPEQHPGR